MEGAYGPFRRAGPGGSRLPSRGDFWTFPRPPRPARCVVHQRPASDRKPGRRLGLGRACRHGRHIRAAVRRRALSLPPVSAADGRRRGGRADAGAGRHARPATWRFALAERAGAGASAAGRARGRREPGRRAGDRVDRPRAGNRRHHQAAALCAGCAAQRAARAAKRSDALGRRSSRGAGAADQHGHAGHRLYHSGSAAARDLFRNLAVFSGEPLEHSQPTAVACLPIARPSSASSASSPISGAILRPFWR